MIQYLQINQYNIAFNKIKNKKYIIVSDADNVFDRIQYVIKSICVKKLSTKSIEGTYLSLINICENHS